MGTLVSFLLFLVMIFKTTLISESKLTRVDYDLCNVLCNFLCVCRFTSHPECTTYVTMIFVMIVKFLTTDTDRPVQFYRDFAYKPFCIA